MSNRRRACEYHVVEGQAGERGADFGSARHNRDFLFRVVLREKLSHKLRGLLRKFGRLDHGAVTGSKDTGKRCERKVYREIPRADDADHTFWLVVD